MTALVRYRGRLTALRGAVGQVLADGRVRLRGVARAVPAADLEPVRWWVCADDIWSGPFRSHKAASAWLADLLQTWGALEAAAAVRCADASEAGAVWIVDGSRVRLVPGGDVQPVG